LNAEKFQDGFPFAFQANLISDSFPVIAKLVGRCKELLLLLMCQVTLRLCLCYSFKLWGDIFADAVPKGFWKDFLGKIILNGDTSRKIFFIYALLAENIGIFCISCNFFEPTEANDGIAKSTLRP